jgi:hypothetical protein
MCMCCDNNVTLSQGMYRFIKGQTYKSILYRPEYILLLFNGI